MPESPAPDGAAPEPSQAERQRFVDDAVHSVGMEGLTVGPGFLGIADDYVRGTITIDEFGSRIRARARDGVLNANALDAENAAPHANRVG